MGYFAGRAAPMGPVGPEVVFATFCNFSIAHVSRAIPDAWTFAPPSAALEARERGSAAALRRAFAGRDLAGAVETAAVLARAATPDPSREPGPITSPDSSKIGTTDLRIGHLVPQSSAGPLLPR